MPDQPLKGRKALVTGASSGVGEGVARTPGAPTPEEEMTQSKFPVGWDEARVRRVLEHYETKSDAEAVAEDEADISRRAAYYVDRILKGAKSADLPVEQATTVELVVNVKTARSLGITIAPSVLLRAEQVVE